MATLAVTLFVLLFTYKTAFSLWWKFSIVYVPLAAILFTFYNPNLGDWAAPPREFVILVVSGLYLLTSLSLIVATFRLKK